MIEKNIDNTEIPVKLMGTLRRGYTHDREQTIQDCPMSENAIAYAFEELAPGALKKVETHLQLCRACKRFCPRCRMPLTVRQNLP
jgi:hypothetical protein